MPGIRRLAYYPLNHGGALVCTEHICFVLYYLSFFSFTSFSAHQEGFSIVSKTFVQVNLIFNSDYSFPTYFTVIAIINMRGAGLQI